MPCAGCPLKSRAYYWSDEVYYFDLHTCSDHSACYTDYAVCDGVNHCHDGEDEANCTSPCRAEGRHVKCPGRNSVCTSNRYYDEVPRNCIIYYLYIYV